MPSTRRIPHRSIPFRRLHQQIVVALSIVTVAACTDTVEPHPITSDSPLAAKGGGNATTPVVSELLGGGASASLRIQSDQLGPYRNGTQGVQSILQPVGDWELNQTDRKSTRTTRIDLSDALPDNTKPAPFASALVKARFIVKASTFQTGSFQGMVGLNSTTLTPLGVTFSYGGLNYGIRMNQANHPRTDWALVTCVGVSNPNEPATSPCSKWRITPTGNHNGETKNLSYLEHITSRGSVAVGFYYLSFDIVITK